MISRSAKQLPGIKLTRLYTVGIRSGTIQGPLLHSQRFVAQQVEDIRGSDGPIDRRICQPLVKPSVLVAFRWSDCTEAWVAEPVCPHSSNRHLGVLPDHKTVKYKILFHHNPVGLVVGLLWGSRSWRVRRQLHVRCQADKGDSLPAHSYTSGPASLICSSCETCPKGTHKTTETNVMSSAEISPRLRRAATCHGFGSIPCSDRELIYRRSWSLRLRVVGPIGDVSCRSSRRTKMTVQTASRIYRCTSEKKGKRR